MVVCQVLSVLQGDTLGQVCAEAGRIFLKILPTGRRAITWLKVLALVVFKSVLDEGGLPIATSTNHQQVDMHMLLSRRYLQGTSEW